MGTTTDIVRNVYSNERGWTPLNYVPGTWAKDFDEWLDSVKAEAWEDGYIAGKAIGLYHGMKLIQEAKQKYREV